MRDPCIKDDNFFDSAKYASIDETFADNLLEIVYTNLEDIRAGRFIKYYQFSLIYQKKTSSCIRIIIFISIFRWNDFNFFSSKNETFLRVFQTVWNPIFLGLFFWFNDSLFEMHKKPTKQKARGKVAWEKGKTTVDVKMQQS